MQTQFQHISLGTIRSCVETIFPKQAPSICSHCTFKGVPSNIHTESQHESIYLKNGIAIYIFFN